MGWRVMMSPVVIPFDRLGGGLNQSQGGIYICGAMEIGLGATVKLFRLYLEDNLAPSLDSSICVFHLGISLGFLSIVFNTRGNSHPTLVLA